MLKRSSLTVPARWVRASRLAVALAAAVAIAIPGSLASNATHAWAQSPSFTVRMKDYAPTGTPPGTLGKVVEGLGMGSCSYSVSQIENATLLDIDTSYDTVTEISPQSYCTSISGYESRLDNIKSFIEQHANNPGRYWAGFMLDEEPGFLFTPSQLETLNNYVASIMVGTPGLSWYFEEDQPNGWSLSTYNTILEGSWPAPQVYSSSMANAVNSECNTYGECTNDVTVDGNASYPWDSASYVTGLINGSAWYSTTWGSKNYFCNIWVPV